ncbi:MAG TPA: alpha/beta family hydrolase [Longimicrobiales bacterium]
MIETVSVDGAGESLLIMPEQARWLYVFAHGAGAGMRHSFMEAAALALAARDIATLRHEFPYMARGSRRPDPAPKLEAHTRRVVEFAAAAYPKLRIAAGGKSMGGRMTSRAQSAAPLPRVEALVFFGFPLHPPGKPSVDRADHLRAVRVPMLFLQGTRDDLADLDLLRSVTDPLGALATLHVVDGADHSFGVLKRSGRTNDEVLDELGDVVAGWLTDRGTRGRDAVPSPPPRA